MWADEVLKMAYNLLSQNASPIVFLKKAYTRLQLMVDKHKKVPVKNIVRVFARHGDDRRRVESALEAAGCGKGGRRKKEGRGRQRVRGRTRGGRGDGRWGERRERKRGAMGKEEEEER
ncbi:putative phospholipase C [Penaeus vannamei]|uniref:Putative phospholipase C n=1 Tax=Penaeus vannamei TaxID=6689 RepID=A0A3R7NE09_PENVA|nr:putative phospholipase C [Penaeus vannamei]